jgi:hypothetical protein
MSVYDRGRRYLLCDYCGAPVEVQVRGGSTTCGHCRAPLEVRMRPEAAVALPSAGSEPERIALLAAQERSFLPPPDIATLFAGDRVAPAKEAEAMQRWAQLRGAVSQDYESARRLFLLTIGLCERLIERGDLLRQRALVESALAILPDPAQQQVLHALLARSALRAGDANAAEAWLALCNPRSEDLLADTAYRFARAYLDTARRALKSVVQVLGAANSPMSDAYAPECAVLCANAWERLGELVIAVDALVYVKRELGPLAARRAIRFIYAHPEWQLCPASEREAQRRTEAMQPTPLHGEQLAALILFLMGSYGLVWAAGAFALPLLGFEARATGMAIAEMFGGLIGVLLTPLSILYWLRNRSDRALHFRGVPHVAYILRSSPEKQQDEGEVLLTMDLLVTPDDAPAYRMSERTMVVAEMLPNFSPGATLVIRVHPKNRSRYELEVPRPVSLAYPS